MRKFLTALFFLLFILTSVAFIGAILSTKISPKISWPFAFLGLGYPILFVLLLCFFIIWGIQRKKKALFPIILILCGLFFLPNAFNLFGKKSSKVDPAKELKIMSYNVRNFEVYDKGDREAKRDAIIALIKKESPDILCLQEAHQMDGYLDFDEFMNEVGFGFQNFEVGVKTKRGGEFGVATFSKHKIIGQKSYPFGSGGNVGSRSDLLIQDDTVSVFNVHLESANIENSYYTYSGDEQEKMSKKEYSQRSKRVAQQLKQAYINRSGQAKTIRSEIKLTTHPVIVCGDFNDTPVSYSYSKIKGDLQDGFKYGKVGFGETYPEIPILRIDHTFLSNDFQINDYEIVKEKISDHYPIITTVQLKE